MPNMYYDSESAAKMVDEGERIGKLLDSGAATAGGTPAEMLAVHYLHTIAVGVVAIAAALEAR